MSHPSPKAANGLPIGESHILIVSDNGFEQSELEVPRDALRGHGATVHVATPDGAAVRGWQGKDWGEMVEADLRLSDASEADYDALVLPGGQMNPDLLRVNAAAIALIKAFHAAGKPIAAICHAPWLLIEAELIDGVRATGYGSIRTDMINAGADFVDESAVSDHGLITSRSPEDLDDFVAAIVAAVEQGVAVEA